MKLNIKQIEVFSAVVEHGSTTAAALHLRISQPSVSKHLKHLEMASGISLFVRNRNRLVPTPEALALYEEIKKTYRGLSHLENFVGNIATKVKYELGIAAVPNLTYRWLPGVMTGFLKKYDHYSISVPKSTNQSIANWVAAGRVDIGLCMKVGDDIGVNQELLIQLPLVCVLPTEHRLSNRTSLSPEDLDNETLITLRSLDDWKSEKEDWRSAIQDILEIGDITPRNLLSVSTTQDACEFASNGLGITLVDALSAMDFENRAIKCIPFEVDYTFDIYIITPKAGRESALISDLLEELRIESGKLAEHISYRQQRQ